MKKKMKVILVALAALAFPPMAANRDRSLRDEANRLGLLVGAAVDPKHFSEPDYAGTLAREFNMIEPENAMKWNATEPARGQFNFAAGDQVVEFAEVHQMKVRGHNLLWGIYNPVWLSSRHLTSSALREIMHQHIAHVVGHYAGKVFAWDVVNEAFDAQGGLKHSIWYDQPGIGLAGQGTAGIEQAFRWAHEADPKALLLYNDYDAEGRNPKSDAIYAMAKDFKRRGVPIDGIGLQMHLLKGMGPDPPLVDANITRLAELGVQVHITEMDVALPTGAPASEPPDAGALSAGGPALDLVGLKCQAKIYGDIAGVCARNPGCTALQTWGFTDRYSWIPQFTHFKMGAGLLFDPDYRPKPAYDAVLKAFEAVKQPPVRPVR